MNDVQDSQKRSKPEILVHFLVIAVVLPSILMYYARFGLHQLIPLASMFQYALVFLIGQAFDFPWWMTCVVWLASRSGRTSRTTWLVPCVLLVFASSAPVIVNMLLSQNTLGNSNPGVLFIPIWKGVLMPSLIVYVYMTFALRSCTLHLRPVEAPASPHRLGVLDIMLLTGVVAFCLSIDALVNGVQATAALGMQGSFRIWELLMSWFCLLPTALLWFSFAWLLVERNPKRWIGFVGLAIYFAFSALYYSLILPMYMDQVDVALGTTILSFQKELWYVLTSFAICLFHAVIAYLCVCVMHWKGYRWDFYKQPSAEQA